MVGETKGKSELADDIYVCVCASCWRSEERNTIMTYIENTKSPPERDSFLFLKTLKIIFYLRNNKTAFTANFFGVLEHWHCQGYFSVFIYSVVSISCYTKSSKSYPLFKP